MSTNKIVWGGLALVVGAVFLFGFLLPWMISAASTDLVLAGFAILILIAGYFLTIFVNQVKKDNNEL